MRAVSINNKSSASAEAELYSNTSERSFVVEALDRKGHLDEGSSTPHSAVRNEADRGYASVIGGYPNLASGAVVCGGYGKSGQWRRRQ